MTDFKKSVYFIVSNYGFSIGVPTMITYNYDDEKYIFYGTTGCHTYDAHEIRGKMGAGSLIEHIQEVMRSERK